MAPFFDRAADLSFSLLNAPGTYTRFPFSSSHRPSTIDLAFANLYIFPAFHEWDANSLLSTGSEHVPILVFLPRPTPGSPRSRPRWADTDWPGLDKTLEDWGTPPPPKDPRSNNSTSGFPPPSPPAFLQLRHTPPTPVPPLDQSPGGPPSSLSSARSLPKPHARRKGSRPRPPRHCQTVQTRILQGHQDSEGILLGRHPH